MDIMDMSLEVLRKAHRPRPSTRERVAGPLTLDARSEKGLLVYDGHFWRQRRTWIDPASTPNDSLCACLGTITVVTLAILE